MNDARWSNCVGQRSCGDGLSNSKGTKNGWIPLSQLAKARMAAVPFDNRAPGVRKAIWMLNSPEERWTTLVENLYFGRDGVRDVLMILYRKKKAVLKDVN